MASGAIVRASTITSDWKLTNYMVGVNNDELV